jgi:cobalt-zinc-cadmium efflux system outer membrane protein
MKTTVLCLASFSFALACPALTLPLSTVPERVAAQNPSVAAARLRIEEARARFLGSGRLSNPELGFEFKHDDRFREAEVGLSFDQKFPVAARLRLEKTLSQKEIEAAELEVRDATRKLAAEASALAVKWLALDAQRTLREEQAALAQKLSESSAKFAERGEVSALDAVQSQVDSQRMLLESRQLETERAALIGELKPLLGVDAEEKLTISGGLPTIGKTPGGGDWQQRPDYLLAKKHEEAADAATDLAQAKKWDDISAGLFLEGEAHEDGVNGLEKRPFLGLRFSLPLPLWNKNEGEIAEKAAAAQRARLETKALSYQITNEAAAARAEMQSIAKLHAEMTEKLLPLVKQQAEKLEAAYQTGQTDLITVLRIREQRLQIETTLINARRDWHLARLRHEAATGR